MFAIWDIFLCMCLRVSLLCDVFFSWEAGSISGWQKKANKSGVNRALDSKVHSIRSLTSCRVWLKVELSTEVWLLLRAGQSSEKFQMSFQFTEVMSQHIPLPWDLKSSRKDTTLCGFQLCMNLELVQGKYFEWQNTQEWRASILRHIMYLKCLCKELQCGTSCFLWQDAFHTAFEAPWYRFTPH